MLRLFVSRTQMNPFTPREFTVPDSSLASKPNSQPTLWSQWGNLGTHRCGWVHVVCRIWVFLFTRFFQLAGLLEVFMCVASCFALHHLDESPKISPSMGAQWLQVRSAQTEGLFSFPWSTGVSVLCPGIVDHLLRKQCSLIFGLYQGNHWSNWQLKFIRHWSDARLLKIKVFLINCIGNFTWNSIHTQYLKTKIFTDFYPEV